MSPSLASSLPSVVRPSFTVNFCAIKLAIMDRVQRPTSRPYGRGSLPLTQANTCFSWRGVSLRGCPIVLVFVLAAIVALVPESSLAQAPQALPTEEGWVFANPLTNKPYYPTEIQKRHIHPAGCCCWLVRSAEPMLVFGVSRTVVPLTANVSSSTRSGRPPLGSMAESAGIHSVTPAVRGWAKSARQ